MPRWIELRQCDVIRQAFRGSGPGGQHKNKTETCIRLIHKPTGLRVEATNERSQHANLIAAWKMLEGKVNRLAEEQAGAKRKADYQAKPEATFGAQIRTYRLCGNAQCVTDHRTGHAHPSTATVLRGELDGFLLATIRQRQTEVAQQ